jgi:5-(carboxyamino)imidazole ribonucleotide synthase
VFVQGLLQLPGAFLHARLKKVLGQFALYAPFGNEHANHILDVTTSPAAIPDGVRDDAWRIARGILEGFDVVGVLCVELFLLPDGTLYVNEIAPRPHNSGHITIGARTCSQFEQQVRAVCGLPLGDPTQLVDGAAMANLLGDLWPGDGGPDWAAVLGEPGARLHLYGKGAARPGRKMGHLNLVRSGLDGREAAARVRALRDRL